MPSLNMDQRSAYLIGTGLITQELRTSCSWTNFLGARDGEIKAGYFAFDAPGTPQNTFARPQWWPANLDGWRIRRSLTTLTLGTTLRRREWNPPRSLAIPEDVRRTMSRPVYEDSGTAIEVDPLSGLPDSQPRRLSKPPGTRTANA